MLPLQPPGEPFVQPPLQPLVDLLHTWGCADWGGQIQTVWQQRLLANSHGHMPRWRAALAALPSPSPETSLDAAGDIVRVVGPKLMTNEQLSEHLMQFHPWRKGPFELFGLLIDTEWQSFMKWERLSRAVDFRGKRVLDVGCGNGYYGWKMLAAGASHVIGCDPYWLYLLQFFVLQRYAPESAMHWVIPLTDQELPDQLRVFEVVLSMGVLYHRTSPIEHLQKLGEALIDGGQLVIETLVVDSADTTVLVPADRYAKMRNVWFIPSPPMLVRWLERTGFTDIRVVDVTPTTTLEQRRTAWMTFESLADFLDPSDATRTIEGYPAPRRAMVTARR